MRWNFNAFSPIKMLLLLLYLISSSKSGTKERCGVVQCCAILNLASLYSCSRSCNRPYPKSPFFAATQLAENLYWAHYRESTFVFINTPVDATALGSRSQESCPADETSGEVTAQSALPPQDAVLCCSTISREPILSVPGFLRCILIKHTLGQNCWQYKRNSVTSVLWNVAIGLLDVEGYLYLVRPVKPLNYHFCLLHNGRYLSDVRR